MAFYEWRDDYSVENETIDAQHKKLVGMVNELYEAMSQGRGKQVITDLIKELYAYAKIHFSDEEAIMAEHGYPDLERHSEIHRRMMAKVQSLAAKHAAGDLGTHEFARFLKDWLNKHILGTDQKYVPYITK